MFVAKQTGNAAQGSIVAGNQTNTVINNNAQQSPLSRLYEKFREANAGLPYTAQISDQLQHYCATETDGDVRGLAEKLKTSDRDDLLVKASQLKEAAAKKITRWQTSGAAQDILTVVLANLCSEFLLHITPAIQAGEPRAAVDALISEKVINPTAAMLGENDLLLTKFDLMGLLFFLGGNCHVRWDAC